MTCGNPIKHKLQKVVENWLDMFSVERKLSDHQMEFVIMLQEKLRKCLFFITDYIN